jgi:Zn-dependent protease with chaperone function
MNRPQWRALSALIALVCFVLLFVGTILVLRDNPTTASSSEEPRNREQRQQENERTAEDDEDEDQRNRREGEDHAERRPQNDPAEQGDQRSPTSGGGRSGNVPREYETGAAYSYDPQDPFCQLEALRTDELQEYAHSVLVSYRDQRPQLSPQDEERLGRDLLEMLTTAADSDLRGPILRNDPRAIYLSDLLARIVAHSRPRGRFPYEVSLLDSGVNDAFALPGGQMVVTTAFLQGEMVVNEAQLVGVLAHEVGHIHHRHTSEAWEIMAELGESIDLGNLSLAGVLNILGTPLSSAQEDEADAYGIEALESLGYSPYQFERVWAQQAQREGDTGASQQRAGTQEETMQRELDNLLQTHASARERSCRARTQIQKMQLESDQAYYVGRSNLAALRPWDGR